MFHDRCPDPCSGTFHERKRRYHCRRNCERLYRAYISKTYLYETCDLKENTISALTDVPYAADASSAALDVDGVAVPITDLTETLTSFEAISDYYYHIRTEQAIARYDFSCTVDA